MADVKTEQDLQLNKKRKVSAVLTGKRGYPVMNYPKNQQEPLQNQPLGMQPLPTGPIYPPSYQDSLHHGPYLQQPQPVRQHIRPFSWDPDVSRGLVESPPVSPLSQPLLKTIYTGHESYAGGQYFLPPQQSCDGANTTAYTHNAKVETVDSSSGHLTDDASAYMSMFENSDTSTPRPTSETQVYSQNRVSDVTASTAYTANAADIVTQQLDLFTSLETACTNAARSYWRSQCESAFDLPQGSRVRYRRHPPVRIAPYALSERSRTAHIYSNVHPSAAHPTQQQLPAQPTLRDYIHAISDGLWRRASCRDTSPSAQLEAVHRIGNLYTWTEHVVSSARGEFGLASRGTVFNVVMAARDMCTWMLDEAGKKRIEALWETAWAVSAE